METNKVLGDYSLKEIADELFTRWMSEGSIGLLVVDKDGKRFLKARGSGLEVLGLAQWSINAVTKSMSEAKAD